MKKKIANACRMIQKTHRLNQIKTLNIYQTVFIFSHFIKIFFANRKFRALVLII